MDRPFLTYQQRPYDSPIAFLHELRAVCENALDIHPQHNDPVHSSARDVHDFVEELLIEQDANIKEAVDLQRIEVSSASLQIPSLLTNSAPSTSSCSIPFLNSVPPTVPQLSNMSAQNLNIVLMNEILNQRQLTAQMGLQLLQALIPQQQHNNVTTKEEEDADGEYWERHSESEEESSEFPESLSSSSITPSINISRLSSSTSTSLARISKKRMRSE